MDSFRRAGNIVSRATVLLRGFSGLPFLPVQPRLWSHTFAVRAGTGGSLYMGNGWIKIHRQIEDNSMYFSEPFNRIHAWIDLLILANHEEKTIYVRGNKVVIPRGFIGWGEESLAKRWKWSRGKVRRFLKQLETEQQIVQQKSQVITLVQVINYDRYQSNGTTGDTTDGTTDGQQTVQQTDTNKNVKNVKNEKNTYAMRPETKDVYNLIDELCKKYGIANEVNINALDIQIARHVSTIRFRVEIPKMFTWLIEKGRSSVRASNVAGWFEQAKSIQKREQLRQLERKEADINPAAAERRKKLKTVTDGFSIENSVSDFLSAQPT